MVKLNYGYNAPGLIIQDFFNSCKILQLLHEVCFFVEIFRQIGYSGYS